MNIRVMKIKPMKNHKLYINFNFGIKGIYDTNFLLEKDRFKILKDEKIFNKVKIYDCGKAIVWNKDAHLCVKELFSQSVKAK